MREGLGFDMDKATSKENVNMMIGRGTSGGSNTVGDSSHIFSKDRIQDMSRTDFNSNKLRTATNSNLDWDRGVQRSLNNKNTLGGVDKALYGNKDYKMSGVERALGRK